MKTKPSLFLADSLLVAAGLVVGAGCPTIDMNGAYEYIDFPFSGWPRIEIATVFPSPVFTGTFEAGFFGWYEIPIYGTISAESDVSFMLRGEEAPYEGLCVCRGYDDGSSIFPGSGQIAGDQKADRLACRTLYGQPIEPPGDLWRTDREGFSVPSF